MSLARVFISAEITAKEEIAKLQNKVLLGSQLDSSNTKIVAIQNFHFTIIFIGEVETSLLEQIILNLAKIKFNSFNFNFTKIGGFPNSRNAKIVWIGVDNEGTRKMVDLQKSVQRELHALVPQEKNRFVPHITLFRIRSGAVNLESMFAKESFSISIGDRITSLALKQSILTPLGPKYHNITEVQAE